MALDTTPLTEVDAFTSAIYPPLTGTRISAADVASGLQVAANRTKNLEAHKVDAAGGTLTGGTLDGTTTVPATSGLIQVNGFVRVGAGGLIEGQSSAPGGALDLTFLRVSDLPSSPVDAATITIDATVPHSTILLPVPTLARLVVMKSTSTANPLIAGQRCRLIMPPNLTSSGATLYFTVEREDATPIAEMYSLDNAGIMDIRSADLITASIVDVYWDGSHWRGLAGFGPVVARSGW